MPNIAGSFSGNATSQALLSARDVPNHELQLIEIVGIQRSTDPDWNNARVTYWAMTDGQAESGTQRGYFNNEHADGDRDWGTFEGTVTTTSSGVSLAGTFTFSGGSGKLEGISGNGSYQGRMTSLTQVEMEWNGAYQLAGTKASGAP
jgi:hypothetical protein